MRNQKRRNMVFVLCVSMVTLLIPGFVLADNNQPMTPELAAKKEMVRKQRDQRIDHKQKQTAADALKAERMKIYKAKQLVNKTKPVKTETE